MRPEEFLEKTPDAEIRTLASLVFSREGMNDDALRRALMLSDLKAKMQDEIVHFYFWKGDGSLRSAYGTRDADLIRQHVGEGKGEAADRPLRTFTYFDIVRGDWRSFRPESIERIDPGYAI